MCIRAVLPISADCCLSWSTCRNSVGEQDRDKKHMQCAGGGGNFFSILAEPLLFQLLPHCLSLSCHAPPWKNLYGKLLVQVSCEGAEILCRCLGMGLGRAKQSHLQLNLPRDVEDKRPSTDTSCKRKTRGSVCLLLSGTRIHVTKDKAEVLHVFFALVSAGKATLWDGRPLMPVGHANAVKINPWMRSLKVRNA